ncbi:MAG: F0F1 ATP synthase subunit B [Elusimicrobia bacterium]|nr:F0F1 ATP synthase subunit B [Elusimicrobiota bacterium]
MDKLLTPDPGLMIWTIVTFLCLLAILKKAAWGPLLGAIDARDYRLKEERLAAEKARSEAERIQRELEEKLAGVHAQSREMLAAAAKDGEALRAKLKAQAEADAEAIKQKTSAELAAEKNRLVAELRGHVADLSLLAAEKLIGKSMDEGVQKVVLDGFFKDLASSKAGTN